MYVEISASVARSFVLCISAHFHWVTVRECQVLRKVQPFELDCLSPRCMCVKPTSNEGSVGYGFLASTACWIVSVLLHFCRKFVLTHLTEAPKYKCCCVGVLHAVIACSMCGKKGPLRVLFLLRNKSRDILPEYTEGDTGDYGAQAMLSLSCSMHLNASCKSVTISQDWRQDAFMTGNKYEHKGLPSIIQVSTAGGVEVVMGNFQVQPMPHCDLENWFRWDVFKSLMEHRKAVQYLDI